MGKKRMDYSLLLVTFMIVAFGLLMVYSSSYYYAMDKFNDSMYFFRPELRWIIFGSIAMLVASKVNYKFYKKIAIPLFIINVILLAYVLKAPKIKDVNRWIVFNGLSFQPAEITKASTVFLFAYLIEKNYKYINKASVVLTYLAIIAINGFLIMEEPNMSTAIIVVGISAVMIFVGGLHWRYVILLSGIGVAGGWALVQSADYRLKRYTAFLDPFADPDDTGFQVVQSLYALGSGGVHGVGLGMSTQNKLYIPEPQNDMILATIGEEFGFIGLVILMVLFLILIYRCAKIAINAPDKFSMFLGVGFTAQIALQVIMNFAVVTSSMPVTGVSLPFVSYGGTSISILLASIGVMLNISKHCITRTNSGE